MKPTTNSLIGHKISLHGEDVILLPQRGMFWPARNMLIVADLHLGKDDTFRSSSMMVPGDISGSDLDDLEELATNLPCDRILILGDFVHHRDGMTKRLDRQLRMWRARVRVSRVQLVTGNHDRGAGVEKLPDGFELLGDELTDGPFTFRHHPDPHEGAHVIAGHTHPVVVLRGRGGDKLRVPCFTQTDNVTTLPSFGSFTGGFEVSRDQSGAIYAVAGRSILQVPTRAAS
jgi:DNA ligase-associated metallophosphoesterase